MSATIRVVVADDQAIVRDGLVTVLDLLPDVEVVGEAADGDAAVAVALETRPDVVLMDLRMPVSDGAAATARLASLLPEAAVLVLTTFADDASVDGALAAGASGYLTKDATREQVAAAVRAVAVGTSAFSRGIRMPGRSDGAAPTGPADPDHGTRAATRSDAAALRDRFPTLTPREAEVLSLIAAGRSNGEIAAELVVTTATVKTHVNALFAKLAVRDRAQAVALALRG